MTADLPAPGTRARPGYVTVNARDIAIALNGYAGFTGDPVSVASELHERLRRTVFADAAPEPGPGTPPPGQAADWPADLASLIVSELAASFFRGREADPGAASKDREATRRILAVAAPAAPMTGRELYETWRAAVPDFVCNVPGGPWDELSPAVRAGFDAIAVRQRQLEAAATGADRIVRDILESLCRRDGLSLESTVVPGEPARNYALAERLGIGHVFGLPDIAPAAPQPAAGTSRERRALKALDELFKIDSDPCNPWNQRAMKIIARGLLDAPDPQPAPELAATEAKLRETASDNIGLRKLLAEIGVMAANAPEDDGFAVCEEIAMRIAGADVPDAEAAQGAVSVTEAALAAALVQFRLEVTALGFREDEQVAGFVSNPDGTARVLFDALSRQAAGGGNRV